MPTYHLQNRHLPGYNPVDAGYETCKHGHAFGPAARTYILLHYVESGSGSFTRGENTYTLSRGMCFVIRPGEITYYRASTEDPWQYTWIGFTADMPLPLCLQQDVLRAEAAADLFKAVKENLPLYNGEVGESGRRETFLCGIVAEIAARFALQYDKAGETKTQSEMRIVKNYIDTQYTSPISVGGLAELFHLERTYFSRCFKQVIGASPQEYIVQKRLTEAAKLLREYDFTPTAAANAVGYADIYLFSKMFKRRFGVSPREYKAKK